MKPHVCPWWLGHLLANPVRRILESPEQILGPHARRGMTAMDVGCGMGFLTLPLARRVGPEGRVIAVDLQPEMLAGLEKRARRAGMLPRLQLRRCSEGSLGVDDLRERVHLVVCLHVVHEVPDPKTLFAELAAVLAPGGRLIVVEPPGHVTVEEFTGSMRIACEQGLVVVERLSRRPGHSAVLARRTQESPVRSVAREA